MISLTSVDETIREIIEDFSKQNSSVWSLPTNDKREHIHALFQYPAMMVPGIQSNLIYIMLQAQPTIQSVFDPFVGAGTVMTAALHNGLSSYGQDINPLAILLSRVKTGPFYCVALSEHIQQVVALAQADKNKNIEIEFNNLYKWFRKDVAIELSKLRRAILKNSQPWARRFMWATLAETVRLTSNDRTTTYKLHARPSAEIVTRKLSPVAIFAELANRHIIDMHHFKSVLDEKGYLSRGSYINEVKVALGDTTQRLNIRKPASFDLITTSPPYGDNATTITYGQHAYLPLQWIDLSDISGKIDGSFLRTTQEIDRRSLGGTKTRALDDQIEKVSKYSSTLAYTLKQLKDMPRERVSKVSAFFYDFEKTLKNIVDALKINGYIIWTIGNRHVGGLEIPNDKILIELMEKYSACKVTSISRDIYGKRMPHRNGISKMMSEEKILIFRKTR